jgi:hypothetical protein
MVIKKDISQLFCMIWTMELIMVKTSPGAWKLGIAGLLLLCGSTAEVS